ncbi:hypothetical protein [Colwellia sp. 12G3]|uniref:hypothetical protein n=1 Tax=Colwellia sp. 12G3 TaxID=2058299 RepID=UPI000C34CE2B|nr:hypothetical protein [Colwellia sp. 12G3]PKI12774.1 hypothetical protein CXF71_18745 [Colwellia sp. 12G3]
MNIKCVIAALLILQVSFKAFSATPFTIESFMQKGITETELVNQMKHNFKLEVLGTSKELLLRTTEYSNKGVSTEVIKRFALASIQFNNVAVNYKVEIDKLKLILSGDFEMSTNDYDNYADAYFKNKMLANRIEAIAHKVKILEKQLATGTNKGQAHELIRLQNDIWKTSSKLNVSVKQLAFEDVSILLRIAKNEHIELKRNLSDAFLFAKSSFGVEHKDLDVSIHQSGEHMWSAKVDITMDWEKLISTLPSSIKVHTCEIYGNEYYMLEKPLNGWNESVNSVLSKNKVLTIDLNGTVKELVYGMGNHCGSFFEGGSRFTLLKKATFEFHIWAREGADIVQRFEGIHLNEHNSQSSKLIGY